MNLLESKEAFMVLYTLFISFLMIIGGIIGIVYRRNLVAILISIEVILNAINLNFILFSRLHSDINSVVDGQVFALFNILIAAVEITIGLSIIFAIRNYLQTSDIDKLNKIKEEIQEEVFVENSIENSISSNENLSLQKAKL